MPFYLLNTPAGLQVHKFHLKKHLLSAWNRRGLGEPEILNSTGASPLHYYNSDGEFIQRLSDMEYSKAKEAKLKQIYNRAADWFEANDADLDSSVEESKKDFLIACLIGSDKKIEQAMNELFGLGCWFVGYWSEIYQLWLEYKLLIKIPGRKHQCDTLLDLPN
jgi:hypothetical protein